MILLDAHVHIHACFDLDSLLNSAAENFRSAAAQISPGEAYQPALCLADDANRNGMNRLRRLDRDRPSPDGWFLRKTGEEGSVVVSHPTRGSLTVLAGRQIQCAEGTELLALCSAQDFQCGIGMQEACDKALAAGAIVVLPWGFGKWLGRRANLIRQFLEHRSPEELFLGDNGGRPAFWPEPAEFEFARRRGFRILPGSDPLPFPPEARRVASSGLAVAGALNAAGPASDVKRLLADRHENLRVYGHGERPLRFLRNQVAMQFVKRRSRLAFR